MAISSFEHTQTLTIHASEVRPDNVDQAYEFTLNDDLILIECGRVVSVSKGLIAMYRDFERLLAGKLFELNHVRVDLDRDHSAILKKFVSKLTDSGAQIANQPTPDLMRYCFQPVGQLASIMRFYYNPEEQELVFLSHKAKLKVVSS